MAAKCSICTKPVYPMDPQINLDGKKFHKPCAKCLDCGCQITTSNFTKNEADDQTTLLCKIHYFKRFNETGSYGGGEKFRVKSMRDMKPVNPLTPVNSSEETDTVYNAVKAEGETTPIPGGIPGETDPEPEAEAAVEVADSE
jgi:hypothetical protein